MVRPSRPGQGKELPRRPGRWYSRDGIGADPPRRICRLGRAGRRPACRGAATVVRRGRAGQGNPGLCAAGVSPLDRSVTRRRKIVTTSAVRDTEHDVKVGAPAERVYALIADVGKWPEIFPPTVHAECVEKDGNSELIRIWATANGTPKTWTSRREHDPERMSVSFRQERSQHPVGGMGGKWVVEPVSESGCHVRLLHDFFAASDDPADLDWISQAVDRNSMAELRALKTSAELTG